MDGGMERGLEAESTSFSRYKRGVQEKRGKATDSERNSHGTGRSARGKEGKKEASGYEISYVCSCLFVRLNPRAHQQPPTSKERNLAHRRMPPPARCEKRRVEKREIVRNRKDRIGNLIERAGDGLSRRHWQKAVDYVCERFKVEFRKAKSSRVICLATWMARNLHICPDKYELVSPFDVFSRCSNGPRKSALPGIIRRCFFLLLRNQITFSVFFL